MSPLDGADPIVLRDLPQTFDAEQALLGAILVNNRAYDLVADMLRPEHFSDQICGAIFEAIGALIVAGRVADPVTMMPLMQGHALIPDPAAVLPRLLNAMVGIQNARDYAVTIREGWVKRETIRLCAEAQFSAYRPAGEDVPEILHRLETGLMALSAGGAVRTLWDAESASREALEDAERAFADPTSLHGASTGYASIDNVLGGLEAGTFNVLAGRPGMGKTSIALGMAVRSAARSGLTTLYYSGEMTAKSLTRKLISARSGIPANVIRRGGYLRPSRYAPGETEIVRLAQGEIDRLVQAQREVASLPFWVEQQSGMTVAGLQSTARRIARGKRGLGLIVVDYLDLLRPSRSGMSQTETTTDISQGLLYTAKSLGVPMIALQQLSREVEKREDKRPVKSDLRNSGQIEQDADSIMFVYRENYYLRQARPERKPNETEAQFLDRQGRHDERIAMTNDEAEILIRKNRHGEEADLRMQFHGPTTWFRDMSERKDSPTW